MSPMIDLHQLIDLRDRVADRVTGKLPSSRPDPDGRADEYTADSSVTIRRDPMDVYNYWRDLAQLPTFMTHLRSVEVREDGTSHWVASAPAGATVSWDAEITEDVPGASLAWRSLPGAAVGNSGRVQFTPAPAEQGTEVRVHLEFTMPGRGVSSLLARLFGEHPSTQVADDLRRFKSVLETGEVLRSDATLSGMRTSALALQRPANPSPHLEVPQGDRVVTP